MVPRPDSNVCGRGMGVFPCITPSNSQMPAGCSRTQLNSNAVCPNETGTTDVIRVG